MTNLILGDSYLILKTLAADSVDAVVTDPPYGLSFMNKHWDHDVPSVELWREVLRVLKPGGHVLSFGGTRTYHRMVVNIEDAGFEIRDQIQWIYGSGFPKSLDVSKAIDKAAGAEREVVGTKTEHNIKSGNGNETRLHNSAGNRETIELNITAPSTHAAKQWQGWGTALKPANEPIVLARKPLIGTVAENVKTFGTGALNIDASRIATTDNLNGGTYSGDRRPSSRNSFGNGVGGGVLKNGIGKEYTQPQGRWPANVLFDEEAAAVLDEQTEYLHGAGAARSRGEFYSSGIFGSAKTGAGHRIGDSGGASRFFYVAKASKRERGDGNHHPTVKPIKLMEYLVRLITPPCGTVLDPFMGSGTTGIAAKNLGFGFVGIERSEEYFEIAKRRI